MRILLVQPDFRSGKIGFRLAALPEPLALELLAAAVPEHEVEILDMRLEDDLDAVLRRFAPDVVGVTALTPEVYAAQAVLEAVKRFSPEIRTVAGGHHATLIPEDFYQPYVDAIGRGDGEVVFPQLIEAWHKGHSLAGITNLVWRQPDGQFVDNGRVQVPIVMNDMPLPRRDLVAKYRPEYFFLFEKPDTSVATGRGCPYRCSFCSVWEFHGGRTPQMTPERVLAEVRNTDTPHLTFVDDNFLMNHRRETAIAELLEAEGIKLRYSMECRTDSIVRHPELIERWAKLGLYGVLLGLEGASEKMLQQVNKKNSARVNDEAIRILQANGVVIWGAFLVDPEWTADDFKVLQEYALSKHITHTQFTVLTPLPGTELYRKRYHDLLTHDYTCFDALHAVLPTRLPREEFYQHFAGLYTKPNMGMYWDLVAEGKLTIEDCKRGSEIYKRMGRWEYFAENDPVLRRGMAPQRKTKSAA